jgi:predicted ester cyclase
MDRAELERLDDEGIAAWDKHDPDAFAEMFAESFTLEDWATPEPIRNDKDAVRRYVQAWFTALPDFSLKRMDRLIDGNAAAGVLEFSGTNTGTFAMGGMELPPTNKTIRGRGAYLVRVDDDGKIVEFHAFPDAAGIMMQLGMTQM